MPICNWMFWTTSQMCYSNPLSQIACEIALFIHYSYSPILTSHSLFLSVAHCGGHFSNLNDFSNSSLHAVKLSVKSYSGKLFGIYVKFIFEISWKWKHHLQWDIQLLNILCTVFLSLPPHNKGECFVCCTCGDFATLMFPIFNIFVLNLVGWHKHKQVGAMFGKFLICWADVQ